MTFRGALAIAVTFDIDKIAQAFRLLVLILIVMMTTSATVVTIMIIVIIFTVAMIVTGSLIAVFSLHRFLTVVPIVVPGFLSTTVLQVSTAWSGTAIVSIVLLVVVVQMVTASVAVRLLLMVMMMLLLRMR